MSAALPFSTGIHHVTLITRRVQANVDFYAGFLGLRLVKRTGGFEDAEQLHLFYGDRTGSPGTLVTFLVWEDGAPGRVGTGQVSEIAFAVPRGAIGEWLTRALDHRVPVEGPAREMGEPVLRLKDPDGVIVKLVGVENLEVDEVGATTPQRLHGVTILTDTPEQTAAFVERFGYRAGPVHGSIRRMVSDTDVVDVRDASGYVPGIPGTGTADHVAFRAANVGAVKQAQAELAKLNSSTTNFHDRKYFTSLYVREPGGTLIELATDGPGLLIDEDEAHLGETLFVPPDDAERAADIRVLLPQFSLPGEPRMPRRELPFVHRFFVPEKPGRQTLVLLHGTGGNEADLMPLAHRIAPDAALLGVRGRAGEEGVARWFKRYSAMDFDQEDIRSEALAFEAFIEGLSSQYGLDTRDLIFLGLSNGANFLAAFMALHPGIIHRAVLLRATPVLDEMPKVDLAEARVLLVSGQDDPHAGEALADWFRENAAATSHRWIEAGHGLSAYDTAIVEDWLGMPPP